MEGWFYRSGCFFVISGYLISGLLYKEWINNNRIDLKLFYAKRIRRLAPALVLVVVTTLLLAYIFLLPDDQVKLGREVRAVATLYANHYFLKHAFDYFDANTDLKTMLHIWSLAVEEQYYLLWPLLLWGAFRLSKAPLRVQAGKKMMWIILSIVLITSFTLSLWLSYRDTPKAFYLMPTRAWEFAAGALLAIAKPKNTLNTLAMPITALGLILLLASFTLLNEHMIFPGVIVLLPVLGSVLFILGGSLDSNNMISRCIGARPWKNIGLLSYGFYLWHWPLLALGRYWGLGERNLERDLLLGGGLALLLAWLSYRYVEQPLRYGTFRIFSTPRRTLWTGFTAMICLWLLATTAMYLPQRFPWPGQHDILLAKKDTMSFTANCGMPRDGIPLSPRDQCLVGAPKAPLKLLAWGDSHTDHLMPMYNQLAKEQDISILRRVYHGCPPVINVLPVGEGKQRQWCANFAQAVNQELPELAAQGLTGVLINARWNQYTAEELPSRTSMVGLLKTNEQGITTVPLPSGLRVGLAPLDRISSLKTLKNALSDSAAQLEKLKLKLVLILPEPEMQRSPPECVARFGAEACDTPRQQAEAQRQEIVTLLKSVASQHRNIQLWDPLSQFCDANTCFATRHGRVVYQDKDHITASMALTLSDSFRPTLNWALTPLK